jgi:tripartite-type tricarboxylate transporter receptor subunit TctC
MSISGKSTLAGLVAGAVAAFGAAGVPSAHAADAAYFAGKTMKIVIPFGFGGTYGKYARVFADHLPAHLPGTPNIIVQEMPGAGGVKAMNFAYNVMPKDGLNLLEPIDTCVIVQLMQADKVRYDVRKFTWLGSSNQTNNVMVIRTDAPGHSVEALMKGAKAIMGSTGPGSDGTIFPRLAAGLLGFTGMKVISGYKGSAASMMAIEQGEVHGAAYNWLAWSSSVPHWFSGDKPMAVPFLQAGLEPDPDLPDVPLLGKLVAPADKPLVDFVSTNGTLGRGLVAPPGTPKAVIAMLRAAYDAMNADPAFKAGLDKLKLRLVAKDGKTIQEVVDKAINGAKPEIVERANVLIYGAKG